MRVLKFRQLVNGKFHYWGLFEKDCFIGPANPRDPSDQFTGLLDKNGKEIYEGDIVKRICKTDCCGMVRYTMQGTVEWFVEGWVLKEDDDNSYGWANQKNEEVEVIGNIHENAYLLK